VLRLDAPRSAAAARALPARFELVDDVFHGPPFGRMEERIR
jgi:hypothetical protein